MFVALNGAIYIYCVYKPSHATYIYIYIYIPDMIHIYISYIHTLNKHIY